VTVTGNYNQISELNFNGYSAQKMVRLIGHHNTLENSNFQNKPAQLIAKGGTGNMVQIDANSITPGENRISHCTFQHMPGMGGDFGNESIRIGESTMSGFISRSVIEYNYFEDTGYGDSESISVKSQENVLRYNTANNNPNAMFTFRNGDHNIAYGNFFIKSGGIRVKEANHIWAYNNYFDQSGINQDSTIPGSGTAPIIVENAGTAYGNDVNWINNTFYLGVPITIASGLSNVLFVNNVFYQPTGAVFSASSSASKFRANLYSGTLGIAPASGLTSADPLLLLNSSGYYGLSARSPAIGAASADYPAIPTFGGINSDPTLAFDLSGQNRPTSTKDLGAVQFNASGPVRNRPLRLCDAGPSYLRHCP
jgi:poly(beta-D-mannuronate) lyase